MTSLSIGTGSSNAGAFFNFGSSASTDRALGSSASGAAGLGSPGTGAVALRYGVLFTNNTGSAITSLSVTYTGEQWRNGGNTTAQILAFEYATGSTLSLSATSGYTSVSNLSFTTLVNTATAAALDGNASANRTTLSQLITFTTPVANGESIILRWNDLNDSGNDHGFGIDDLSVTATIQVTGPQPPVVANAIPAQTGTAGTPFNFVIPANTFSDPNNDALTYTVSGLPDGLSFSSSTSAITGTPTTAGGSSVTVVASDPGSLSVATTFTLTINPANSPSLAVSPNALSGFTTSLGTASAEQSYTVTTANLTNDVTVTASGNVQISTTSGSAYTGSLTIPAATTSTVIFVRLSDGAPAGPFSGNITHTSGVLTATVSVSGTVSVPVGAPISIATARTLSGNTVTVEGRVTVSSQFGGRLFYIQDATAGMAVFSGASPAVAIGSVAELGDLVRVTGLVKVFNGYLEIDSPTGYTITKGTSVDVPAPVVITSIDQLSANQGRLVQLADATFTSGGTTFATTSSNYSITAGGQNGIFRVNASSELAGATKPTTATLTGIAERFVNGSTAAGNDNMQLQGRILRDVSGAATGGASGSFCAGDGTTSGNDSSFDLVTWNVEWFGHPTNGPSNNDQQATNVRTVLQNLNADIYAIQEISDLPRFAATVSQLGSYSYVCSDRYSYSFSNPPDAFGQRVCVVYKTSTVTPVIGETRAYLTDFPVSNYPTGNNSSFWASGRFPFLFTADVNINGATRRVRVINIHAKSGSATEDLARRVYDLNALKQRMDADFPNDAVILTGDYNDDVDVSIAVGNPSPYKPFVDDAGNYRVVTSVFNQSACSTTGGYPDAIDHIMVSNELFANTIANATTSVRPIIANYLNSTSDHYPSLTRFAFAAPVTALTLTASASPSAITTSGTTTLSATVAGGSSPYTYSFSGPGTITPSGNTASVSGLSAGVQTFTVTAVDATSPTAQTTSTTVSVSVTQQNLAPVAPTVAPQSATVGAAFSYVVPVFTDPNGDALTYAATGLPANGLSFDATSRAITGTPSTTGTVNVTVTATDPGSLSASVTFTITISPAPPQNLAPVAPTVAPQSATVGTAFSFTVPVFTDPNGDALTYAATGLPANGLSFDATSRTITGTPSMSGTVNVTVSATDPGSLSASVTFAITVSPVASTTTAPPSGSALTLLTPTYNCSTGDITFNTTGGDGTTITYVAIGVQRASATSNTGVVEAGLRADAKPLTISATQSGTTVSITFDFAAFCANPGSGTTTTPPSGSALALLPPTYNCATGDITFNTQGGDGTTITYSAVGVRRASATSNTGVVEAGLRADAKPLTISATQSGVTVSITFDFGAFCANPGSGTTTTPPTATTTCGSSASTIGQSLQVTGVTDVNCQTGTFRILTSGGNGSAISYANIVGLSNADPTNCLRSVDGPDLLRAINTASSDIGPFSLRVSQGSVQSNTFSFNFKQYCTAVPARIAREAAAELNVTVLGNPTTSEAVEVDVRGAGQEAVRFVLTTVQGRVINQNSAQPVQGTLRQRIELGNATGIYLLQVTTDTQKQTVKIVKQ